MSKITTISISSFNGGISDDPREDNPTKCQMVRHFDIFSQPNKLITSATLAFDHNDGSTDTGMKQYLVRDFLFASTSLKLYGLGQTGAGNTKIFYKADATQGNWTLPGSSEGNGAVKNGCLIEYKDYLWGFQGTNQIFKWGLLSGTPSITDSASTTGVSITSVAQGLVFEDYLYLPYNNRIWRATDATTFSDNYLTLPTNFKITSLTAYGKYIAIACAPISTFNGKSKVFLWDGTSTEIQEAIDWGEGELRVLESIDGYLVGITDRYLNNAVGRGRGSMIIRLWSGGTPQIIKEVFTKAIVGKDMPISKSVRNNRLYFIAKIMTNTAGTEYNEGIWCFGRKNALSPYALSLEFSKSSISSSGIQAFGNSGDYFHVSANGDGTIYLTNGVGETSQYYSQIFDFGAPGVDKTLLSFNINFSKILATEQANIYYRVNDQTSWTLIGNVAGSGIKTYTFIKPSTSDAFVSGHEYEFRIDAFSGIEITGLSIVARVNDYL